MLFINAVIDGDILIYRKKKTDIIEQLKNDDYPMILDKVLDNKYTIEKCKTGFNYLINIPLYHLTDEKINELQKTIDNLKTQHDILYHKNNEKIWLEELKLLKDKIN